MKIVNMILIGLCIGGCTNKQPRSTAREKADLLLEKIGKGGGSEDFPEEFFPSQQTKLILSELVNHCDFANRKGAFVNDYYQKNINGTDLASFIYEFQLRCDTIRFILTYQVPDHGDVKLQEFKLEPVEEKNTMVLEN